MTELENLLVIAQVRYDQKRQTFAKIVQQEEALRQELKRISGLDTGSNTDARDLSEMRAIGADIMWSGWLARAKTTLNTELAGVLAKKALEMDRVRAEFGKLTALDTLITNDKNARRKKNAQAGLSKAIVFGLNPSP